MSQNILQLIKISFRISTLHYISSVTSRVSEGIYINNKILVYYLVVVMLLKRAARPKEADMTQTYKEKSQEPASIPAPQPCSHNSLILTKFGDTLVSPHKIKGHFIPISAHTFTAVPWSFLPPFRAASTAFQPLRSARCFKGSNVPQKSFHIYLIREAQLPLDIKRCLPFCPGDSSL